MFILRVILLYMVLPCYRVKDLKLRSFEHIYTEIASSLPRKCWFLQTFKPCVCLVYPVNWPHLIFIQIIKENRKQLFASAAEVYGIILLTFLPNSLTFAF